MKHFLHFSVVYMGFVRKSVTTMSWSEIPGTDMDALDRVGLFVKTKSSRLSSQVGAR